MKFKVNVEKEMYVTGTVIIYAKNKDAAENAAKALIVSGDLEPEDVEWGDWTEIIQNFRTTGDVEKEIP
jgi:hypothetical protein